MSDFGKTLCIAFLIIVFTLTGYLVGYYEGGMHVINKLQEMAEKK